MVGRGELTDAAWARIEPLLPATGGRGGRWRDHRQVINAVLWQARTGAPWRDLPERYGPWKTAHERLRKWTADGTWDRVQAEVIVKDDAVGAVSGPSASTPVPSGLTSTPPEPGKGGCCAGWIEDLAVDREALGRSRGGLTCEWHLAVDGRGLPMAIGLTAGHPGDNPQLLPLLDAVSVARTGPGRPRRRPDRVVADRAYSHPFTPGRAARPRHRVHQPRTHRPDRPRKAKGSTGGRPPAFDRDIYAGRNVVERCFARLKQFRALATRYAKRAAYYRSILIIAAVVLWLREDPQDTP